MNDYKASPLSFKFLKLTLCIDSQKRADAKNLYQFLLMNDLLLEFQSEL